MCTALGGIVTAAAVTSWDEAWVAFQASTGRWGQRGHRLSCVVGKWVIRCQARQHDWGAQHRQGIWAAAASALRFHNCVRGGTSVFQGLAEAGNILQRP